MPNHPGIAEDGTIGRYNPFNGQPGFKWWKGFQKRFPQLVDRKAQHLPKHWVTAGTYSRIQGFLAKVRKLLKLLHIADAPDLGDRLWNCDESGVCTSGIWCNRALCVETPHSTYFTATSPLVSVLFVPSLHSYYFSGKFLSFLVSVLFMQVNLLLSLISISYPVQF